MEDVVVLGRALLALGSDIDRVHRGYIVAAFDLLGEAEALAVLAVGGDRFAHEAIEQVVVRLVRLRQGARDELGRYTGDAED